MQKILLGLDVRDAEYAERIQKMLTKMSSCEFSIICYEESIMIRNVEYWLSDGTHLYKILEFKCPVILMADKKEAEMLKWSGERIEPYTSVKKMLKQIRACIKTIQSVSQSANTTISPQVALKETPASYMEARRGKLFSVYSPIGGCGKSTLAMTLCESIAEAVPQSRTLYFNLEGTSDWPMFFGSKGEYNLSDFLYSMLLEKPDQETAGRYIDDIAMRQESGVYFIEPCNVFEDLNVLEENEIQQLIDILRNQFDFVVCDLNTAFHSINKQFLQQSEFRFLLSNGTQQGQCKLDKYREGLQQQHLEQEILGNGLYFIQIGSSSKAKNRNQECHMLPLQKELYVEKNGMLKIRHNSEWYRKVKMIAEEVTAYART